MQDPEDAVVAHSLFDPHLEPQDADGELEDPSMLPSSGVGYEIEKHDQLIEGMDNNADAPTFPDSPVLIGHMCIYTRVHM